MQVQSRLKAGTPMCSGRGTIMAASGELVVEAGVTSRNPGDLDDFSAKIIEEIAEGRHARRSAA